MLSDADREMLAEARRLDAARTPGAWHHFAGKLRPEFPTRINHVMADGGVTLIAWPGFDGLNLPAKVVKSNAQFIAHCGTHQTRLLEIIAELEREVARLHDYYDRAIDEATTEYITGIEAARESRDAAEAAAKESVQAEMARLRAENARLKSPTTTAG